jgi:hypothetical protein
VGKHHKDTVEALISLACLDTSALVTSASRANSPPRRSGPGARIGHTHAALARRGRSNRIAA